MTEKELDALITQLQALAAQVRGDQPLNPAAQQALGGRLFRGAPDFVRLVAFGLDAAPELFAGWPVSGADLRERQGRADGWWDLYCCLGALRERAWHAYLREQAPAVDLSQKVMQQIDREATLPFFRNTPEHFLRQVLLDAAARKLNASPPRKRHRDHLKAVRRAKREALKKK